MGSGSLLPAATTPYINSRHRHPFVSLQVAADPSYHGKPPYPASLYTPPTHLSQGVTVEPITDGDNITFPQRGGMIPLSIIIIFLFSIRIRHCHNSLRWDTHRWQEV